MRYPFVTAAALALTACATDFNPVRDYGDDALPSAQVEAFERVDAELGYDNAQIGYDDQGCMMYQGVAPNGQVRQVPLADRSGDRMCPGKRGETTHNMGNDGLPSAQVEAFQRADARLNYSDARIERGDDGCLMYRGTAADGVVRQVPLQTTAGAPICG